MSEHITENEFHVIRDYIEKHCGIHLGEEKRYLIEARLTTLMVENGCRTFGEFHARAIADTTNALRDRIMDSMTTNETLWFRDGAPFAILEELLIRQCPEVAAGKRRPVRIWCVACSTGQEPFSIAMTVLELNRKGLGIKPEHVEITASDISPTALFLAKSGRYDSQAMSRGLSLDLAQRYFTPNGRVWLLKDTVRNMVTFRKHNLQDDFSAFGRQDIVFCRNILIYFSDEFKRDILRRLATVLRPGGYLVVGASESVSMYSSDFSMITHAKGLYYQVR
jgi:chemotaxis protein methyltransferase CheR